VTDLVTFRHVTINVTIKVSEVTGRLAPRAVVPTVGQRKVEQQDFLP